MITEFPRRFRRHRLTFRLALYWRRLSKRDTDNLIDREVRLFAN